MTEKKQIWKFITELAKPDDILEAYNDTYNTKLRVYTVASFKELKNILDIL